MRMAKALRIVIETAAPRCDDRVLAPLHALAAQASPLLRLPVEDCAGAPVVAVSALLHGTPVPHGALAAALRDACRSALAHIPPIDHRSTRSRAKRALRAVAAIERLADALQDRRAA